MTAKHTPGPWSVEDEMDNGDIAICNKSNSEIIAFVCGDDKKAKLDACLIAAAPELLEALSEYLAAMDSATFHFDKPGAFKAVAAAEKARKVIAKATGDTA